MDERKGEPPLNDGEEGGDPVPAGFLIRGAGCF
jgi:hypothetical protein